MYCCKYCSKHGKRKGQASVLYEVLDDMERKDAYAQETFRDGYEKSKLGSKLHRMFMSEVGEEMCQAEVAHHANGCPEYLCSRPAKYVSFYKKLLGVTAVRKKNKRTRAAGTGASMGAGAGSAADEVAYFQEGLEDDLGESGYKVSFSAQGGQSVDE